MFNVRVFPGTEIEHFALEQGISKKVIEDSQDMSYAEGSPTIAFSKEFTTMIRARFIKEYMI